MDPNIIFGIGSTAFPETIAPSITANCGNEVEVVTIHRGRVRGKLHEGDDRGRAAPEEMPMERRLLLEALQSVNKECVWRIKGLVQLQDGAFLLNWAFGRFELISHTDENQLNGDWVCLTGMGQPGEVKCALSSMAAMLDPHIMVY